MIVRAGTFSLLISAVFAVGCSSNGQNSSNTTGGMTTGGSFSGLIVPDDGNNRVLLYNFPLHTGQSANVVLGQTSFSVSSAGATANTMAHPLSVAMDVGTGDLYVSENVNCRVTQFNQPFTSGMSASIVFGQPNLNTASCSAITSPSSLGNPSTASGMDEVIGVAVDTAGNLWVADSGSNRVVEFQPPFSSGMSAVLAIGQVNFTSSRPNRGETNPINGSLYDPVCPAFDRSGNLWIPDFLNHRVLEFIPPFATGMPASLVLGQPDFTHGVANQGSSIAANTLYNPNGIAFDASGNLWISDGSNNRVLEFIPPFTNDMTASLVLGQADFASGGVNRGGAAGANTLNFPHQIAFDIDGSLLLADSSNNRVLVFEPPFSSGMSASIVIGQQYFNSTAEATSAAGLYVPGAALPVR